MALDMEGVVGCGVIQCLAEFWAQLGDEVLRVVENICSGIVGIKNKPWARYGESAIAPSDGIGQTVVFSEVVNKLGAGMVDVIDDLCGVLWIGVVGAG